MSFGFSASDFVALGKFCWSTYKKCKESSGQYALLTGEVQALQSVLRETEELLSDQNLTENQQDRLSQPKSGCEGVLRDLNKLLEDYRSLGTQSQRTFDRIGFGNVNIDAIRIRLTTNITLLDAFNNA